MRLTQVRNLLTPKSCRLTSHAVIPIKNTNCQTFFPDIFDFKVHQLPLARIKKIMKSDDEVRMISQEAPVVFAKGFRMDGGWAENLAAGGGDGGGGGGG
jgi:hypothetical protein